VDVALDRDAPADVGYHQVEGSVTEMSEVVEAAGAEVVHDTHPPASIEEVLAQV
jgi:hypothetical protein